MMSEKQADKFYILMTCHDPDPGCSSNRLKQTFNPSSPNSDQHQFSPNNIHTMSRGKVMRINKMIA